MSQNLQILPGNAVALAIIGDLFERAFDEPYGNTAVTDLTKSPATWSLVAFQMQNTINLPVGFIIGMTVADIAEIYSIGVPQEFRGRGFAKSLLERALQDCKIAGADNAFLEVAADNSSAIGLYRHAGFRQNGLRKDYYRRGRDRVDAMMMTKEL